VPQPRSLESLPPIPDISTTIAAILPKVAAITPPVPQVLAEILPIAPEVRPLFLGRLRVAVLDVLLEVPPIAGHVASVGSDIPGIAPDLAPILPNVPRILLDILCARDGRPQSHRQRTACQHRDQSSHRFLLWPRRAS
jgi:hypothetical protein